MTPLGQLAPTSTHKAGFEGTPFGRFWSKKGSKKGLKMGPKRVPKWVPFGSILRTPYGSRLWSLEAILGSRDGPIWGSKWGQKGVQKGVQKGSILGSTLGQKGVQKVTHFLDPFGQNGPNLPTLVECIWSKKGPFWGSGTPIWAIWGTPQKGPPGGLLGPPGSSWVLRPLGV